MALDAKLGELHVDLVADDKRFERDLRQIERDSKKSGKKAGKKFGEKFDQGARPGLKALKRFAIAAFAAFGFIQLFRGLKRLVLLSSDVTEAVNKNREVFGKASKGIEAFADRAATSLGASTLQALQMTGEIGNLLVAMKATPEDAASMSKAIVQLSADLGSFNNVPTTEALNAIRAALIGETEPMRRFGSNVSQARIESLALAKGISKTTLASNELLKAQLRLEIVFSDTKKAQGDFKRTSNDLANLLKIINAAGTNAAATLGKKMIPLVTRLAKNIKNFVTTGGAASLGEAIAKGLGIAIVATEKFLKLLDRAFAFTDTAKIVKLNKELRSWQIIIDAANAKGLKGLLTRLFASPEELDHAAKRIKEIAAEIKKLESKKPAGGAGAGAGSGSGLPDFDFSGAAADAEKPLTPFVSNAVAQMKIDHIRGLLQEGLEGMDEDQAEAQKKNEKRLDDALSLTENAFDAFFSTVIRLEVATNNRLVQGFVEMANVFISEVARMAAKWLAFKALQAGFGAAFGIPIPLGIPTAKHGADFINSANIKGESALLRTGAGERVRVTPRGQVGQEAKAIAELTKQFQIFALNQEEGGGQTPSVAAEVNITRRQIQLMVRQSNRREARFRGVGGVSES